MMRSWLRPSDSLSRARRLASVVTSGDATVARDAAILIGAGALAGLSVVLLHLNLKIPGHVILRGAIPMALGLALAPRRNAGSLMSIAAAISAGVCLALGFGQLKRAAAMSLVALGPAIDLTLYRARSAGWRLYLRLIVAGVLANLAAFAFRFAPSWLTFGVLVDDGSEGGRRGKLWSFVACGAVAGLLIAVAAFRVRADRLSQAPGE